MSLAAYAKKRNFKKTPEPKGEIHAKQGFSYVIQKHDASRLHYDLRLELDGTLKSWAIPKGPSLKPADKRLAVQVEDHPIEYGEFEGTIPKDQYGGGTVMLWDRGHWEPLNENPAKAYQEGTMKFRLHGEKLQGVWALIRMKPRDEDKGENWLLVKDRDEFANDEADIIVDEPNSVSTGRTVEEIARGSRKKGAVRQRKPRDGKAKTSAQQQAAPTKASKATKRKAATVAPSSLTGARKKAPPAEVKPQLCTLAREVPKGEEWIHEIKFDGYRIVAHVRDGKVRLETRNNISSTAKYPGVVQACKSLRHDVVLDGEVVVVRPDGSTDFQALQNALREGNTADAAYYLFDILHCDGYDLSATPLLERKALLKALLSTQPDDSVLRYSDHVEGDGGAVYDNACKMSLEGVISKRADSPYVQKRSSSWVKVKCTRGQELVIGGYTDPGGARKHFGALLLGYYDPDGDFIYAGKVGTGFTQATLASVGKAMQKLRRATPAFKELPLELQREKPHWLTPKLVCELEFTEWTGDGHLRHPSFKGLRDDKPAKEVIREKVPSLATGRAAARKEKSPVSPRTAKANLSKKSTVKNSKATVSGVAISSPDKELYPEGISKVQLAEYYDAIAPLMLPHITGRPLMLLRCPQGRTEKCFYQKHLTDHMPEHVRGIPIEEKSGTDDYLVIDDKTGLLELVNLGVLEFHVWGAHEKDIEHPDMMVFDLDPDPAVPRDTLVQAVFLVRDRLESLGLKSFLKATGGKGFHVCVPLNRSRSWDEVKAFSKALADEIAEADPKHFTATMSLAKRKGKIFIDYLRNGRGATFIAPYSTRARANATVAAPLAWEKLTSNVDPAGWAIAEVEQLHKAAPAWKELLKLKQGISTKSMKGYGL